MGLLQNEDHKSEAEIIAAGGTKAQLLNDTKIYITASGINKTLDDAIADGNIGGSGGGASFLNWNTDSGAPLVIEDGLPVYKFEKGETQVNKCILKIPKSFTAGAQLKLAIYIYSTSTSGTQLIRTNAYLIRPGVETIDSTVNLYASSNAAAANTGISKCPQKIELNISAAASVINGITIAADHLIRLEMDRDSSAGGDDTDAIRVLQNMEPIFS